VGQTTPGALNWQTLLPAAGSPPRIEFLSAPAVQAQENAQLLELHDGADSLITELSHADAQIAALQAQAASSGKCADLALTAKQSFARVDSEMQRWNLRAEEIERAVDPVQTVSSGPKSGSLFAGSMHYVRNLWQRASLAPKTKPQRVLQNEIRDQRRSNIRQDLQRMTSPALRLRQHEVRIKAVQAQKLETLRAQLNTLAQPRSAELRKVALARLASIHDKVDHMALELHHHREDVGTKVHQRLDRRRQPRAPLPAPVYKPKQKQDESA
jgi:hypothetical protein